MRRFGTYITWEHFFLLFIVLMAGGGCDLVYNMDPRTNPLGTIFFYCGTIFFVFDRNNQTQSNLKRFLIILFIWVLYHLSSDKIVKYLQYINFIVYFGAAYSLVLVFKKKLFEKIASVITLLTIFDLFLWVIQNIVGIQLMTSIAPFSGSQGTSAASFLLYNVSGERYLGLGIFGMMRNCGFAWEPGRYACICIIGIFCNLMVNKSLKWSTNKGLYFLVIGLLTTFSTTGYVALLVLFCMRYLFVLKKISLRQLASIIVVILSIPFILNLPFMRDKILSRMNSDNFFTNDAYVIKLKNEGTSTFTVDRFEGIVLSLNDVVDKPLMGYGLNSENSWCRRNISDNLRISNGLTKAVAEFGIPLSLLLMIVMLLSSYRLRNCYPQCKNSFFVIFVILNISYNFIIDPLMMTLSMNYIFFNSSPPIR